MFTLHNGRGVVATTFENLMNGFQQDVRKALEKIAGMSLLDLSVDARCDLCQRESGFSLTSDLSEGQAGERWGG